MKPTVKSKNKKLNLQIRPTVGTGAVVETDLSAHSSELTEADLSKVAAYGATRSCHPHTIY